jgi:DNA-directed RNA polymerase subunit omega
MKLVEGFDSNYRYVLVAARRARQLQNGARPVVESHSRKPCRIAEEELQAGKVKWEIPPVVKTPLESANQVLDHAVAGDGDD